MSGPRGVPDETYNLSSVFWGYPGVSYHLDVHRKPLLSGIQETDQIRWLKHLNRLRAPHIVSKLQLASFTENMLVGFRSSSSLKVCRWMVHPKHCTAEFYMFFTQEIYHTGFPIETQMNKKENIQLKQQ